jgi:hypothetical protein
MKNYYNIYYNNNLINKKPISSEDVNNIFRKKNSIIKYDKINDHYEEIPTNKLKIIKCTII